MSTHKSKYLHLRVSRLMNFISSLNGNFRGRNINPDNNKNKSIPLTMNTQKAYKKQKLEKYFNYYFFIAIYLFIFEKQK